MTLEELSVVFSADLSPFSAAAGEFSGLLSHMSAQADSLAGHFYAAGVQAGTGLRNGILARQEAIVSAARQVAQAAASALQAALQIHSPSRITYEAGRYFDEGLLEGIQSGAGRVANEAGKVGNAAAHALSHPAFEMLFPMPVQPLSQPQPSPDPAYAPISITIPLEVDGYQLGVAAIEGINRVSRGTGRVELNI